MVQYHMRTTTKQSGSGGKRRTTSDKRLAHIGGFFAKTKLAAEEERAVRKIKGGGVSVAAKKISFANVAEAGKVVKSKITGVVESKADRHHARENIITKGTVIDTELGRCRVTSKPGQHGVVNAVLMEKKAATAKA
ncbi:MAG: 30S ribosomal protein S8e [Candidatus Micrarchaeota archaeon]|nr:30S ribosomal protein S8e [Candidatus Micrarchaeota archaeon]